MTNWQWVCAALVVIALFATLRLAWQQRRGPRVAWIRFSALLILQWLVAATLFFTLVPPQRSVQGDRLTVLLSGAGNVRDAIPQDGLVVALPEAGSSVPGERAPDLATALRRHPAVGSLQLVGDGLSARDRTVALPAGLVLRQPAPPRGWAALQPPAAAAPGAVFAVGARAQDVAGGHAELLDPAGQIVARAALDGRGAVQLEGTARVAGRTLFQLRLLDPQHHLVDTIGVPVEVIAPAQARVLLLAGAPGPEHKYLRRWATDAGMDVRAHTSVGAGVQLGDAVASLSPATLAKLDLLVLDERSIASLGAAQRAAISQALHGGLGVLVRTSSALSDGSRQVLRSWGLAVTGGTQTAPLQLTRSEDESLLPARRGPRRAGNEDTQWINEADARSHAAGIPALERFAVRVSDAQPLLIDADGEAVGGWRGVGRGRIGLLPVIDSYRLVLAGRDDRHAEVWSSIASSLARPLIAAARPRLQTALPWSGERSVLCNVADGTRVRPAGDVPTALVVDPSSGAERCAAWWPRMPGWHELLHGDTVQAVYVFDPTQAQALHRQQLRDATALRASSASSPAPASMVRIPGPRWPWLLAFLLCTATLWWLERRHRSA